MLVVLTAGHRRGQVWTTKSPSSSGLGLRPFKAAARVRIPLGARKQQQGPVAQLVSASPCHGEGRGFESRLGRSGTLCGPDGQVAQLV
jgi:hypothetical protein